MKVYLLQTLTLEGQCIQDERSLVFENFKDAIEWYRREVKDYQDKYGLDELLEYKVDDNNKYCSYKTYLEDDCTQTYIHLSCKHIG